MVSEICSRTDRQTDKQTYASQSPASLSSPSSFYLPNNSLKSENNITYVFLDDSTDLQFAAARVLVSPMTKTMNRSVPR